MTIILNGQPHALEGQTSIRQLLSHLGMEARPVVVELDERALFPRDYDHTLLADGSRVEIVALAAGG